MRAAITHEGHHSFFDFAESILFDAGGEKHIDYKRLDVDAPFYDVAYEKSVRRKCLNLIYVLDEIRQEMGYTGSKCIDLLIQIEKTVRQIKMHGINVDHNTLQNIILELSDAILAEIDFVGNHLSLWEYKIMRCKLAHLNPIKSRDDFICELRKYAFNLQSTMQDSFLCSEKSYE